MNIRKKNLLIFFLLVIFSCNNIEAFPIFPSFGWLKISFVWKHFKKHILVPLCSEEFKEYAKPMSDNFGSVMNEVRNEVSGVKAKVAVLRSDISAFKEETRNEQTGIKIKQEQINQKAQLTRDNFLKMRETIFSRFADHEEKVNCKIDEMQLSNETFLNQARADYEIKDKEISGALFSLQTVHQDRVKTMTEKFKNIENTIHEEKKKTQNVIQGFLLSMKRDQISGRSSQLNPIEDDLSDLKNRISLLKNINNQHNSKKNREEKIFE